LVLAGIEAQWRPLRALLFQQVLLLDLSDPQILLGQSLKGGKPGGEAWEAPVPPRTCRAGVPVALDALGDFIGDLLLEHSAPDAALVVALPWEAACWRVLEWLDGGQPEDATDELRERHADLGWPFNLEDASLDVQPLANAPGCSLAVGMSLDALESWIEVFAIAGATLRHLIPAQVCQQLAIREQLEASADQELVALLQPDSQACHLLVWRAGVPEFSAGCPWSPPSWCRPWTKRYGSAAIAWELSRCGCWSPTHWRAWRRSAPSWIGRWNWWSEVALDPCGWPAWRRWSSAHEFHTL